MVDFPSGVWPVMLTPFTADGGVDWDGVDALTEWYIESGVAGLFAVCLSSEMYHLTEGERLALARRVVKCVEGRVPVVASGTFGGSMDMQVASVNKMAATGVDAVVVLVNQMVEQQHSDKDWQRQVARLLEKTVDVPLGLYECPTPYHRVLSPQLLGWCAGTGRFGFIKETSCQQEMIAAKVAAIQGSPLKFFNANTPTLLDSLRVGAHGYCGTAANFFPDLFVWLCRYFKSEPEMASDLQRFLSVANRAVGHMYKTSAKQYLALQGVPVLPVCRDQTVVLKEDDLLTLQHLQELVDVQRDMLGLMSFSDGEPL